VRPLRDFSHPRLREIAAFFIGMVAVTLSALAAAPLENLVRDGMMVFISPFTKPPSNIVVVSISESTLAKFPYRSPIDRGFLADIIAEIDEGGATAIGIDLLFDQPTENDKDQKLKAAIQKARSRIILANATQAEGLTAQQVAYLNEFAPKATRGLAVLSHDRIDGVVRTAFWGRMEADGWIPSFAAAIASAKESSGSLVGKEQVYYRGGRAKLFQFPIYPAESIAFVPKEWFRDKYVLIGATLPNEDRHSTPFVNFGAAGEGVLPGVIIHAHSLASIVSNDAVVTPNWLFLAVPYSAIALLCIWIAWASIPIALKPTYITAAIALVWLASATAFSRSGVLLPVVLPSFVIVSLCSLTLFAAWRRDNQNREVLRQAFSRYVSPSIVSEIVRNPELLKLGGERRYITAVFTDAEGFTSLSESISPESVAGLLNEYLDQVCNLFLNHGATIDKIVGDAVVGFFGAPADQKDQANRALQLTHAIGDLSARMHETRVQGGLSLGMTRVGVHHGPAIVGNFGGNRFFNYSAIGDTVNIASRLESANKHFGTKNCVSSAIKEMSDGFLFRQIGQVYLRGKRNSIDVFELSSSDPECRRMFGDYASAYEMLLKGDPKAIDAFRQISEKYPQDGLIAFYRARLQNGQFGTEIDLGR